MTTDGYGWGHPLSQYRRWKPWKMPRPREYAPKPLDPGQPAEWDAGGVTRTGVIWSRADRPNTWWAQPDDDPAHPVYLSRPRGGGSSQLHEFPKAAGEARANIVRGNLIRDRGLFAVVDEAFNRQEARWHTDPDCPRAAGKERYDRARHGQIPDSTIDGYRPWTALDVARELAASFHRPPRWLPMCPAGRVGLAVTESAHGLRHDHGGFLVIGARQDNCRRATGRPVRSDRMTNLVSLYGVPSWSMLVCCTSGTGTPGRSRSRASSSGEGIRAATDSRCRP
jgi:hypothetical protein